MKKGLCKGQRLRSDSEGIITQTRPSQVHSLTFSFKLSLRPLEAKVNVSTLYEGPVAALDVIIRLKAPNCVKDDSF